MKYGLHPHAAGAAALGLLLADGMIAEEKQRNNFPAFLRGRGDSNPVTIAKRRAKRKTERQNKKKNRK